MTGEGVGHCPSLSCSPPRPCACLPIPVIVFASSSPLPCLPPLSLLLCLPPCPCHCACLPLIVPCSPPHRTSLWSYSASHPRTHLPVGLLVTLPLCSWLSPWSPPHPCCHARLPILILTSPAHLPIPVLVLGCIVCACPLLSCLLLSLPPPVVATPAVVCVCCRLPALVCPVVISPHLFVPVATRCCLFLCLWFVCG